MKQAIRLTSIILLAFGFSLAVNAQDGINKTDSYGNKQGQWIKKYPDGKIMYKGYFSDNKPVGIFKRYDDEGNLVSVIDYGKGNDTVHAEFYHPNGYIAGRGKYLNKKKTGKWFFYSDYIDDRLLMTCYYKNNMKHGKRVRYHWNGEVAEKLKFINGTKTGSWLQYYSDGTKSLESNYTKGRLNGDFNSWHPNGRKEITGQYSNDIRKGQWFFYNNDGSLRNKIVYINGIPKNNTELIRKETEYLDSLEKEGGKIKDPEIHGIIK